MSRPCQNCGANDWSIGRAFNIRGDEIFPFVCNHCGDVSQQYASRAVALQHEGRHGPLPAVETKTGRKEREGRLRLGQRQADKPCEVCGSTGQTELHHWAPFHLFGDEADKWPTSLLCRPCHVRWHQTVTPNMGAGQ